MVYDPYSAGQYQEPYGQDNPYGYSYGENGEDTTGQTLPPPPDKNWQDPVKVVKEYLRKIKKDCIIKEFEGLKEDSLFVFEVMIDSIKLSKTSLDGQDDESEDGVRSDAIKGLSFTTFVKFLHFSFLQVNCFDNTDQPNKEGNSHSYSDLFQCIYRDSKRFCDQRVSIDEEKEVDNEGRESLGSNSFGNNPEGSIHLDDQNEEDVTFEVITGKSAMFSMTAFTLIQSLQQQPLVIQLNEIDIMEGGEKVNDDFMASCTICLTKSFGRLVLESVIPGVELPLQRIISENHPLIDPTGRRVGSVNCTVGLTCLGQAVVNCVEETEDNYKYNQTSWLSYLRARESETCQNICSANQGLALEIMRVGPPSPDTKTSSEILQHCISSNLITSDSEEVRHALNLKDCEWKKMVETARPTVPAINVDPILEERVEANNMHAFWRKQRKLCQDFYTDMKIPQKRSIFDRLEEMKNGLAEQETNKSLSELEQIFARGSSESERKSKQSKGSRRKSSTNPHSTVI